MQKLLQTVDTQEPGIYDMLKAVELKKQSSAARNSLFHVEKPPECHLSSSKSGRDD